jgi:hypothetical protein
MVLGKLKIMGLEASLMALSKECHYPLSVVLIVTGIEAVMCIPSPLTRLRNNGDFQKITAHTMKVMATSLFVLLSQF